MTVASPRNNRRHMCKHYIALVHKDPEMPRAAGPRAEVTNTIRRAIFSRPENKRAAQPRVGRSRGAGSLVKR
jgi:hypothetical protein